MNWLRFIPLLAATAALVTGPALAQQPSPAPSPQTFKERFFAHNTAMTALQPSWATPLVESDPRLVQYARLSFSHQYSAAGAETVSYGNGRGYGVIGWNRVEVDVAPPAYIQHNGAAADGFGDTSATFKYRIASANADHGNYILTAFLTHGFATGSAKNGAATDTWNPALAGGIGIHRRFALESALGGALPTGKIAAQGRSIAWNALTQFHANRRLWLELENNATFYFSGSHNGLMQNFVTPAAFFVARRKEWKPTHPYLVVNGGMQIATSAFHTYNHNLISEIRIIF
jgi:hypothetical protein